MNKNLLSIFSILCLALCQSLLAQTTYVWNNASGGSFAIAANWTPSRSTPAVDDILVFNTGGSFTVTNFNTTTIGQLKVSNNTNVTFTSTAASTVTINGDAADDFVIDAGSTLNLDGSSGISISLATGAIGGISGKIATISAQAHRLLGADAVSIAFESGSECHQGSTGNFFGSTGTPNVVTFKSGSVMISSNGANPFGLGQPLSKVIFEHGSRYIHKQPLNLPSLSGRKYSYFEFDNASFNGTMTGGAKLECDSLIITSVINANFNLTAEVIVKEGIRVKSGNLNRNNGRIKCYGDLIVNGGNFSYPSTNTTSFAIDGSLIVNSGGTFTLSSNLGTTSRVDSIGGDIVAEGNVLFSPSVTLPGTYRLALDHPSQVQTISGTGTLGFDVPVQLVLENPNGFDLQRDIFISGLLEMPAGGGNIQGNGFTITLGLNDLIPGFLVYNLGSGYLINGKFKRYFVAGNTTTFLTGGFPIGSALGYQSCAVLMTTAPTNGGFITAEFLPGTPGTSGLPLVVGPITVNRVSTNGYYSVEADPSLTGYTYSFQMVGTAYDGVGDYQELVLLKRPDSSSPWAAPGVQMPPSGSNAQFTLILAGLTSFSEFTVAGNDTPNPLPLFLTNFSAQNSQNANYLDWTVQNSHEVSKFEVLKSNDGRRFQTIGTVMASNQLDYKFVDFGANAEKSFYQIKILLSNGNEVYSNVVEVNPSVSNKVEVYPNPFSDALYFQIKSAQEETISYSLQDISGKVVFARQKDLKRGANSIGINTENLAKGFYFLTVEYNGTTVNKKLLKY